MQFSPPVSVIFPFPVALTSPIPLVAWIVTVGISIAARDGETLALGLVDAEGDKLRLIEADGDSDADGEREKLKGALGLALADGEILAEGDRLAEGEREAEGEIDGLIDDEAEALGLILGDAEADGERDGEPSADFIETIAQTHASDPPPLV